MINLHESYVAGLEIRPRDPWICSHTRCNLETTENEVKPRKSMDEVTKETVIMKLSKI